MRKTSVAIKETAAPRVWVGIGASAGGLEALRNFVQNLPSDLPATYIVAQHMAPHHRSMLSGIIGRETDMPVMEVSNNLIPQANTIYITPPNSNVIVEEGKLCLIAPSNRTAVPKPSVDVLLTSLAKEKGPNAIGIILSGTGADGAVGIRSIREKGGVTLAQDDMSAKYSNMPFAAVNTGCVDIIMSPEEMGAKFSNFTNENRDLSSLKASPVNLDSMSELIQLLRDQTSVNFRHYKIATFQRRVERRMVAVEASSLEEYVDIARTSPSEVEALFSDLLIKVTSFFRDPIEFEALRVHIKQIVEQKKDDTIRIWIAGTATGEEAYSIAMLFADEMGGPAAIEDAQLQIFATDLDKGAIEIARIGYYSEATLSEVPNEMLEAYFDKAPMGYTVKKTIREKIVFSAHNIIQDPPFLNLDMISCRNLLIYFQSQLQTVVFARFHYALNPRGVLFLGKSEAISSSEALFHPAGNAKHIFLQRPSANSKGLHSNQYLKSPRFTRSRERTKSEPSRELQSLNLQFESLIAALGPNSVLVSPEMQILKAFGDVSQYVGISEGEVSTSAVSLIREPYRQDVRTSLHGVISNNRTYRGIVRRPKDDPNKREQVCIYPINSGIDEGIMALIVFNNWTEEKPKRPTIKDGNTDYVEQIETLTEELDLAQDNLQQMLEELETSNEELQTLIQEQQSSNEELQSTNEEMETTNEELQSSNEELSTVNEELQIYSDRLTAVNESLRSVLANVAIPMLVVDRELHITHMSAISEDTFGVAHDLVLPHVSGCRTPANFPNLATLLDDAMTQGRRIDVQVDNKKAAATLTAVPHFSRSENIIGAILLLTDSTEELRHARNELQLIFDNLPASVLVRDAHGKILKANKMAAEFFSVGPDELPGHDMKDLCDKKTWPKIKRADKEALSTGLPILQQEIKYVAPSGEARILNSSRIPFTNPTTGEKIIYAMDLDTTEERAREKEVQDILDELSRSNQELNRFSYVCSHDMKEPVRMVENMSALLLDPEIQNNPEQRDELLRRIRANMVRLRGIIDSLLAYSRIDAKVEVSDIDLRDVLDDVLETFAPHLSETSTKITIGKMPIVRGARVHFAQVFQNLIGNALKYAKTDQLKIKISSTTKGGATILRVADNGKGVPEEARERIFELFRRLELHDESDGTGLGLSICSRIVSQYGGTIECRESRIGGALFEIVLPKES